MHGMTEGRLDRWIEGWTDVWMNIMVVYRQSWFSTDKAIV